MATPPSMANEPAASEATPLVTMLEVALLVALGVEVETKVVMVVWPPAVVVELLRMDDGAAEDEGAADDEAALVVDATLVLPVALPVALLEALLEALPPVDEALAVPEAEVVLELALPPVILKGKPYWKMVVSDSRVMMMP